MIRFDADEQRWVDRDAQLKGERLYSASDRQQRRVAQGTLAVLSVCGLVFGGWAFGLRGGEGEAAGGRPNPPAASADPSGTDEEPADSGSPAEPAEPESPDEQTQPEGPSGAELPDGYRLAEDPEGFSLAVPEDWKRRTESRGDDEAVFYENSDRTKQLLMFPVKDADPFESLQLAEGYAEKNDEYERESFKRLNGGDRKAARLEYTYFSEEHDGVRHVIDHRFEAEDGDLYALIAYGPETKDASEEERSLLDTALSSFCAPGADCERLPDRGPGDDGLDAHASLP